MKKYVLKQFRLLFLGSLIIILTNIVGHDAGIKESIIGVAVLCGLALLGLIISEFASKFIKLPALIYVSMLALILASPISPIKDFIISTTSNVAFLAPTTALGTFAGISLGKDLKSFSKIGWKLIIVTIFVISGAFLGSALVADIILKLTGAI